jgi:branched-chain amino acid transport system permease protein
MTAGGIVAAGIVGTIICKLVAGYWVPSAAYFQALVYGCLNAMLAVGIVLIYRASRIINFAQAALGLIGAMTFLIMRGIWGWSYWIAMPIALAVSALTGLLVELFLMRRLAKAPRLALTVVTIAVTSALSSVAGILPTLVTDEGDESPVGSLSTPFSSFDFGWGPLRFSGNHIAVVVVSIFVMAGLAAFFKFSSVGIAVRGAAENDDRAALLGINVNNLSSLVWVLTGTLAGVAILLEISLATSSNVVAISSGSVTMVLGALAAAVVGKMDSLPITAGAAIGIAVFRESMFWAFDTTALIDLAILLLIVGILLAQRGQLARTDEGTTGTWAANVEIRGIPWELKDVPSVRTGKRRFMYALAVVIAAYPWVMSPSQTSTGSYVLINGIIVISLVVLTGWGGQISLGQYAFVAMGGLIGGSMMTKVGLPFPIALLAASFVGAGIAVIVGLPAMRIKGLFLAVTTLAFAVATTTVFLNPRFFAWLQPGRINRPRLLFLNTEDERVFFYVCVAALALALWVAQGLRKSRAGRVLIAMRENERTAQSYSINRMRVRLATFAISGFLAAFAGVLLALHQHEVRQEVFGPGASLNIFLVAVIGGLGSLGGSLVGLVYFALVTTFVTNPIYQGLFQSVGVIAIIMFYPGGLGGMFFLLRDAWLRRVAMRQRIFVPSLVGDYRVLDGEQQRTALAPKFGEQGREAEVEVKYRIPSAIGVRGESQQGHRWRYQ